MEFSFKICLDVGNSKWDTIVLSTEPACSFFERVLVQYTTILKYILEFFFDQNLVHHVVLNIHKMSRGTFYKMCSLEKNLFDEIIQSIVFCTVAEFLV
jgi:hypothetical protein